MLASELERLMEEHGKGAALIEYKGQKGVAIRLGENLKSPDEFNTAGWLSGDIIVFWKNGDHTILPEEDNPYDSPDFEWWMWLF